MKSFLRWGCLAGWIALGCGCVSTSAVPEAPPSATDAAKDSEQASVPILIEGVGEVSKDDLLQAASRELKAFQGEEHRLADLEDAAYSMVGRLRANGFAHGEVTFEVEPSPKDVKKVTFNVNEGAKAYLGKVTLPRPEVPDPELAEPKLQEFFTAKGTGFLGGGRPLYLRNAVLAAATQVEKAFLLAGYYRVRVGPMEPGWNAEKTEANPVIPVEPGKKYTLHVGAIAGDASAEALEKFPDLSSFEGRPFHVRVPAELAAQLRSALSHEGYQLAEVRPETKLQDEEGRAVVVLHVTSGPKLIFEELAFSETERTSRAFIASLFTLDPGAVLESDHLETLSNRLYRTGLFSRVQTRLVPLGDGDPRPTRVEVELEELEAKTVDFELGFGSYELARGGIHYRDRNAFGVGRILDALVFGSLRGARAEVGLTDPYTLGSNNTLLLRGGVEFREEPAFTRKSINALLSVRHDFDRETSLTGGYDLRVSKIANIKASIPADEFEAATTRAGIFLNLRHDTRDNPLLPEDGVLLQAGALWSTKALLSDLEFLELSLRFTRYDALAEGTVLAWGFRGVTRPLLGSDEFLPLQERLYLGGESTVRSFFESELGPTDREGRPLGGLSLFEAHVELRQQLFGNLHGAVFYDIGVVNAKAFSFGGPYGHALGVGLRYLLPVGPARLDFAYNPGQRFGASQDWALHFSFGFSF